VLKVLYHNVLKWAEHKYSIYLLAVVSFLEASFFPIPPDPVLLTMCLGRPKRSLWYALICSIFSVLGAILGYFIGLYLWSYVHGFFFEYLFSESAFNYVGDLYHQNSFLAILTVAFTPIPFKVFTIAAGVFKISLYDLVIASAVGRSARFFIEGGLFFFFGPRIKIFIENYFNLITILLTLLIIAVVVIYKIL